MTRAELTLPEMSGDATNMVATTLDFEQYRRTLMILEEIFINECYRTLYPPIFIVGDYFSEYIEISSRYFNSSSPFALNLAQTLDTATFKNVHLEHVDASYTLTIATQNTRNINIDNVTMINNDFSGTFTEAVFFISSLGGIMNVNDFKVIDTKLGYRSALNYIPSGDGYLTITNSSFSNVTLNTGASLFDMNVVKGLTISDVTFNDVKQVSAGDTSNAMIRLGTLDTNTTSSFTVSSIHAEQSKIPIFEMGSLLETSNSSKSLQLSGIRYTDSVFEFPQSLIMFENIEITSDFEIVIDDVMMSNLTFDRFGSMIMLEHQTVIPLKISNCQFNDIYGGNIHLESANIENTAIKTYVEMSNITASSISGGTNSFFIVKEGGRLTVLHSTFTHIENIENGAVINGNFRNSESMFYNCTFSNNTAYYGGVVNVQDGSVVKLYDSTISNNFAIQSGVIQSSTEGYFEMYNCVITNNYALSLPVAELFIVSRVSVINNSTFRDNTAYSKQYILDQVSSCTNL